MQSYRSGSARDVLDLCRETISSTEWVAPYLQHTGRSYAFLGARCLFLNNIVEYNIMKKRSNTVLSSDRNVDDYPTEVSASKSSNVSNARSMVNIYTTTESKFYED